MLFSIVTRNGAGNRSVGGSGNEREDESWSRMGMEVGGGNGSGSGSEGCCENGDGMGGKEVQGVEVRVEMR